LNVVKYYENSLSAERAGAKEDIEELKEEIKELKAENKRFEELLTK
jgi:FtsZ-binding cell division protein ZapB